MTDSRNRFQEVFDELFGFSVEEKMRFLELFLFSLTVSARAIWSSEKTSDKEQLEALKWLNELNHRVWNIRSDLAQGEDENSVMRFYENMKFYGEQSSLLQSQLVPTVLAAFDLFKRDGIE